MKVFVKGQGEVNLTQQHFVAMGGQASVYVRSGKAYKVYTDPKDSVPEDKFKALAAIADPCVIRPESQLLGAKNANIGYVMDAVPDNVSLCQLFAKSFRDRNHVTPDHVVKVAARLRDHVANVHLAGVVVVDLNELNVLVSKTFDEAYLIDVDSYQTPGYPAAVIMPSVRDWSTRGFTQLTDWFSYAVLTFSLFVGSHPYRGTHQASLVVDKEKRLEHRMRNNISAFRSDVRLPGCCYPLDSIPQEFRGWLKAVLEEGKRSTPPDPRGGPAPVVAARAAPLAATGAGLDVREAASFDGWEVLSYVESAGSVLALVKKDDEVHIVLNGTRISGGRSSHVVKKGTTWLGFTSKLNRAIALNVLDGNLTFIEQGHPPVSIAIRADELSKSGDRFYVRNGTQVLEAEPAELVDRTIFTASHCVADVVAMASRLYEGCAIQSMLGSTFVSLFPRAKAGCQVRVPELDSYRVMDARFEGGVMMVVGARKGRYDRLVLRFDDQCQRYDLRVVEDVQPQGVNFVTLSTGICVSLTEEEAIEAFPARMGAQGTKVVKDPALSSDMRLIKVGGKVGFMRGDKVYQVSMR